MTKQTMLWFDVVITVKPNRASPDLHPLDQEDPLLRNGGTVTYTVIDTSPANAREAALDEFHSTIPIKMIDDFEIFAQEETISAHRVMELKSIGNLPPDDTEPAVLEHLIRPNPPEPTWIEVSVDIEPITAREGLNPHDRSVPILFQGGSVRYQVLALHEDNACALAEAHFASTHQIQSPDDFFISSCAEGTLISDPRTSKDSDQQIIEVSTTLEAS